MASLTRSTVERTWPTSPAACAVVTAARDGSFSTNNTSVLPALARWYATLHPTAPPPITTICALGISLMRLAALMILPRWEPFALTRNQQASLPGVAFTFQPRRGVMSVATEYAARQAP